MNNILLVLQREYLTRVRKRSFIIMSILGPVLMGCLVAFFIYLSLNQGEAISAIKVIDDSGSLGNNLPSSRNVVFEADTLSLPVARETFNAETQYGILYIPADAMDHPEGITLSTEKQPNLSVVSYIESRLQQEIEETKLNLAGIRKSMLDSIKTRIDLVQKPVSAEGGDREFSAGMTAGVGFAGGLLIYLFVLLYGVQVMRGVMEEKTSRIVEVIISSVKPFQLMMGKILGIALVGLTQFLIWVVLTFVVTSAVSSAMIDKASMSKEQLEQVQQMQSQRPGMSTAVNQAGQPEFMKALASLNLVKLLLMFVFYFLGGYLLYSALFAAIGAAVDGETDTQQFMLPITIPLIFAYVVSTIVMTNPESKLGYWFSIVPFTSPVVMMVRMPFDPPAADIAWSMAALVAGFIGTTWLAARIYRTGILMYGKKVTYRELGKWLFYKG